MRYFVTGTDTGVGKTFVSAALASIAAAAGRRVFAFKPVETGTVSDEGDDQRTLCEAAGGWQRGEQRGVYRFRRPAAPLVAAKAEGQVIDLRRITQVVDETICDDLIVEGAGGWRVPFTETADTSGLAQALGLGVVVVARGGLGTINHSLLTIESVLRDGLDVVALVLSRRPEEDLAFCEENAAQISRRWSGRIVVASCAADLKALL